MSETQARQLYAAAQQYQTEMSESGWSDSRNSALSDSNSPLDLFASEERPLVVGLFGGTGVGKSSLLNRLAGADIARTGVVRPTSMEITAYLHSGIQLDSLPQHFASDRFSENRHNIDRFSQVMWVDMPDFDSAETENKEQVLQWLAHIDLLIYVVTPERYKDAEGWRLMLQNGYRHAWLFVMNQWDRAQPVQYTDFVGLLENAGFNSPQVFRTVCVAAHAEDEFESMLDLIESLASHNIISHLQERGWMQRLRAVQTQLQAQSEVLANTGSQGIDKSFEQHWQQFEQAAAAHLDTPFKAHSKLFAEENTNAVLTAMKSIGRTESNNKDLAKNIATRNASSDLWDEWLSVRLHDSISQLKLAEDEHGLPKTVMASLDNINHKELTQIMTRYFDKSVTAAIDNPGPLWQRTVVRIASWLKILLPLAALLWVAWRVVNGFISGATDRSAYVGIDFMVNGLLLAAVGWLIPMVVVKILKPSLPDAVYRSLHKGLKESLGEIKQRSKAEVDSIEESRIHHQKSCQTLLQDINGFIVPLDKPVNQSLEKILRTVTD